jgi:HAE1 family hydrophobic/amphiphilic exporter-1
VQNRVATALGRLPNDVKNIGVTVTKASTGFIMAVGVYAEHGEYDSLFLSNYVDVFIKDALKRVPGVADVIVFGERKYAMRLWLDPTRLASRGITAAGRDAGAARAERAGGGRRRRPAARRDGAALSDQRAGGRPADGTVRVRQHHRQDQHRRLAGAAEGHRPRGAGRRTVLERLAFNGFEAVGFGVIQLPTANALDAYNNCVAELERLKRSFPPGMTYQISFDTATVVKDSIREVVKTLFEAIVLVIIVMFLFLQDWRSTIIPTATIPVSLVGVFAFVKLMGFSINTLTLFGIVLATGIVVDDAIVVIENIQRHIHEYGRTAKQAASEAMGECSAPSSRRRWC